MPSISVYNQKGERAGELNLSDAVFGVKAIPSVVHEAVVAARANARRVIASTKTRGEVSGGGKKPWKQKGTGRARQGSIRSPQWIGGGIVFGPTSERNFSVKVNRKFKKKAMVMALSDKVASSKVVVLDSMTTEPAKTKHLVTVMKALPLEKTTLVVVPGSNPAMVRMARNLQNVKCVSANSLNLMDVLGFRSIVFLKDSIPVVEKLFA